MLASRQRDLKTREDEVARREAACAAAEARMKEREAAGAARAAEVRRGDRIHMRRLGRMPSIYSISPSCR